MNNVGLVTENFNDNKEQIKSNIRNFMDNRFIPRFTPKIIDKQYEIEENSNNWIIELIKEKIVIILYFYDRPNEFQLEFEMPDDVYIETNCHDNLDGMFDEAIKIMTEHKIKKIFIKG